MDGSWSSIAERLGAGRQALAALREMSDGTRVLAALRVTGWRVQAALAAALLLALLAGAFAWKASALVAAARLDASGRAATQIRVPRVTLEPAGASELAEVAALFRDHAGLAVTPGPDQTLVVAGTLVSDYGRWLGLLGELRAASPQLRWTLVRLCTGQKCPTPLSATLRAQRIVVARHPL
jgi:hypothetical protein